MIVCPRYIYGKITFSFPRVSKVLIDDTTKSISKKVPWIDANVPGVFNLATRELFFYSIREFPPTHHLDYYEEIKE